MLLPVGQAQAPPLFQHLSADAAATKSSSCLKPVPSMGSPQPETSPETSSVESAPSWVPLAALTSPQVPSVPSSPPTHHDPEGGRHLGQSVGVVGGDGWDPHAPQQGEEPRRVDRVEVHTQIPGCVVPVG